MSEKALALGFGAEQAASAVPLTKALDNHLYRKLLMHDAIRKATRAVMLSSLLACSFSLAQDLAELEEQTIRAAVARVAPSVVRIDTIGGLEQVDEFLVGEGPTTGLIVSADGYILSSSFNFIRQPSSVLVTIASGQRLPATVVAHDHSRKLVLLQVKSESPLPVAEMVPISEMAVGQWAVAVGRTFASGSPNISVGIISARNRIWGKAIQTDAKISPSNYGGPLVDLRGRVFGILVPLSPNSQNELAGAEWYDGGIGFAIPLADVQPRLDRLKRGEELFPGLLGITLKSGDIYSLAAEIVACHRKSPSYQAGIRAGDTIVEVNGVRIDRQAHLRHALGPLNAGETANLVVMRSGQRLEMKVELAKQIDPYANPFIGLLPERGGAAAATGQPATPGVGIRYVFAESGAAAAGLKVGDRITKLGDQNMENAGALREAMAAFEPKQKVALSVTRDGKPLTLEIELSSLPESIPPAEAVMPAKVEGGQAAPAPVEIKIPEEPNECFAYVPSTYRADAAHGLFITLPQPGAFQQADFTKQWSAVAERFGVIVVAPQSRLPNMWIPTETTFIRKVIDHCVASYNVDRTRIVVYGYQASGSMAYLAAFRLRDIIRGVVAADATIPMLARPPDNDPIERLAVLTIVPQGSRLEARAVKSAELLRDMKYPVVLEKIAGDSKEPAGDTLESIFRWLDTLDRI